MILVKDGAVGVVLVRRYWGVSFRVVVSRFFRVRRRGTKVSVFFDVCARDLFNMDRRQEGVYSERIVTYSSMVFTGVCVRRFYGVVHRGGIAVCMSPFVVL